GRGLGVGAGPGHVPGFDALALPSPGPRMDNRAISSRGPSRASNIPPSLVGKGARGLGRSSEIDHGPADRPLVALTFDAGADPGPTAEILRALATADRRCTFFLTGAWVAEHPQLARRIVAAGHELGNHTYTHRDLRRLSDARVAGELERTDSLVRE